MKAHVLGFPRMGSHRQLKIALEKYWQGKLAQPDLVAVRNELEQTNWEYQQQTGLSFVTVGDAAFYDHVLDTSMLFGVVPSRFSSEDGKDENPIDTMFCMGRGRAPNGKQAEACEMTKWFDTNYHYIVPEFARDQPFQLHPEQLLDAITRALVVVGGDAQKIKPVLVGPLTFLRLGKVQEAGTNKLDLLSGLIEQYNVLLLRLAGLGIKWVQIDEPILVLDLEPEWKAAFSQAYLSLNSAGLSILLTTYFGALSDNLEVVTQLPVAGLHVDVCRAPAQLVELVDLWPADKVLSVGIVNGRNVWKNNFEQSLQLIKNVVPPNRLSSLWLGSSCSLLHSPVDLDVEQRLDPEIRAWLAFAKQKIVELIVLSKALSGQSESVQPELLENAQAVASRATSKKIHDPSVQERVLSITADWSTRQSGYAQRALVQQEALQLPVLPTTTIGSFPQTAEIRAARLQLKSGKLSQENYTTLMQAEIRKVIRFQETLGLDTLVHGEPERNDMVEYFGEQLRGFAFTDFAWVQSYGSRCVKPPILFGDVKRPTPMTVEWSAYAQSLTPKPVKGMLTGPVTVLFWSFVRDDQPLETTARQIALAIRDEVLDLEKAGIKLIQIDEPAFREGLPLRSEAHPAYLNWAAECFRISASVVQDQTQIHTHMCYAEFNAIIEAIAALDADVISIESSRSKMELLEAFKAFRYPNSVGPGIYDIHSPNVPSTEEMVALLREALKYVPKEQLHINPDCGLKTRGWPEVEQSLTHMVQAAQIIRAEVQ